MNESDHFSLFPPEECPLLSFELDLLVSSTQIKLRYADWMSCSISKTNYGYGRQVFQFNALRYLPGTLQKIDSDLKIIHVCYMHNENILLLDVTVCTENVSGILDLM